MKTGFIIGFVIIFSIFTNVHGQFVNCNPDPNGPIWLAGDIPVYTPEMIARFDSIPDFILSSVSAAKELPLFVDNDEMVFFPPVIDQGIYGYCAQAAATYYTFTYEINRFTGTPIASEEDAFEP